MIDLGNNIGANRGVERRAFSLIEMLVVIAVIAIIASLVLGLLPAMSEKKNRARVETELKALVMAIEAYKEKHGFYPPDSSKSVNPNWLAQPPLFYELVGTTNSGGPSPKYFPLNGEPDLDPAQINNTFGYGGFLNTAEDASDVKSFLSTLRKSQFDRSPYSSIAQLRVLTVPAKGLTNINTWRYVVAEPGRSPARSPTNNPDAFDLWAEISQGGKTIVIGNWKK